MSRYRITLKDRSVEEIDGADAYQQEGQMTTFFRVGEERRVVDTWSIRLASFRTSEILAIRRLDALEMGGAPGTDGPPADHMASVTDLHSTCVATA